MRFRDLCFFLKRYRFRCLGTFPLRRLAIGYPFYRRPLSRRSPSTSHIHMFEPLSVRFFGEVLANLSSVTLELNHRPAWSSPSLAAAGGFALVASFW